MLRHTQTNDQGADLTEFSETIMIQSDPGAVWDLAVAPAGTEHSLVTWHTAVEPAELAEMFAPIYREGLENLKSMLEG